MTWARPAGTGDLHPCSACAAPEVSGVRAQDDLVTVELGPDTDPGVYVGIRQGRSSGGASAGPTRRP